MKLDEVRKKYLDFFEKRDHAIISSASLVPDEADSTTLFTSSGMQPLLPYFLGKEHPKGKRVANSQKCFRAEDIEEIGDNRHTTFFEMLGNWSFGDYAREDQIKWFYEFLINEIGLDPKNLYVTVFEGDKKRGIPRDTESAEIWKKLFKGSDRISYYGADKNWWSRSGTPEAMHIGEQGGPDTEVFYDFGKELHNNSFGDECHPNCDCGRFMEIGNSVFMEYIKQEDGSFAYLPLKNVDFGGGLERITAASNDDNDIFRIDAIYSVIKKIEEKSGKKYEEDKKAFRIIADHIRASVFIIANNTIPSNTEQGYVLRRLIRRAARFADKLGISKSHLSDISEIIVNQYGLVYKELNNNKEKIIEEINKEEKKFRKTLEKGLKEFDKLSNSKNISGEDAFVLFTTHGFPIELTLELAREKNLSVDEKEFAEKIKQHQKLSRSGAKQKFKGGLADTGKMSIKYHTTTHLLLKALKDVLGSNVKQKGSNITAERLRLDFSYGEKMTDEQKQKVEKIVNKKIKEGLNVVNEEMSIEKAKKQDIAGEFGDKYGDIVTVYKIGDYSAELCGGPHVKNTSELGNFKIKKEESVSAGVRRIKAILD